MSEAPKIPFIQADYIGYQRTIEKVKAHYVDYPRNVSIETQVKCNAKCSFCPYPMSPRQGQRMSDELFYKIIDDLSAIPHNHTFGITLHRINEPLLDERLQGFCKLVDERLPSANQQFWTNGTMLRKGKFEWMTKYLRATLTVSLNSVNEDEHIRMMGFGLYDVFDGLDYLHFLTESKQFTLPVLLCAPFQTEAQSAIYQVVCNKRWPLFKPAIRPFFKWMGNSDSGAAHRHNSSIQSPSPEIICNFACAQWFDLHVLANGQVTKCCIDETGYIGQAAFNVRIHNLLGIFRDSRNRRLELPARAEVAECKDCFHLG